MELIISTQAQLSGTQQTGIFTCEKYAQTITPLLYVSKNILRKIPKNDYEQTIGNKFIKIIKDFLEVCCAAG